MLFDAAEELVGFELIFARTRAPQQPHMQNNDIPATRLDAIENVP
jgi:hypothetical protein